ncbi:coil containing protein [Vibrio phage 1.213.O._10N.222.54.F10]|nr:coil containing protein [Vibrio phage 1.213.O._10N.222.54.F10]
MSDIVSIGFKVATDQIEKGYNRLNRMGQVAEKTEGKVVKSTDEMSKSFSLLGGNIDTVRNAIAGLAASSGFLFAINANKEFARSVSSLSAITGAVGDDLEFYKQQAAEIGATTTLSASQAVTAFKLIASAKPDLLASQEALAAVTREAVILSEATGGELALTDAASALGGALNQFQLDASEAKSVVNLLAEASRAGSADVVMISDSLVNVGAAANAMGVSLTETIAGLEALAAGEIKGSEAGTGLRQVLIGLEKTNNSNLMPSVVGLTKAVENYAAMNLSTTDTIKMFGAEGLAAASTMVAQIGTLSSLTSTLDGTSTAYNQAATQTDNLDGDLKSLNSVIESLSISFGEDLDPALRSAAQSLTDLLSNTDKIESASKAIATVIIAALVPATVKYTASLYAQISAQLLANTQAVRTVNALGQVSVAAGTATVATNGLAMATRFLLGPWGLLLAAVSAAGIAYSLTNEEVEKQNKSLDDQNKITEKLTKNVKNLTDMQKSNAAIKAQFELNDLKSEQERLEAEILTHHFDENQYASLTLGVNERLSKNKERQIQLQKLLAELQKEEKTEESTSTNEKLEAQLLSLEKMTSQLSMTEEQRFIDDQVRKAKERGDTDTQIALIKEQAQAYIDAKNKKKEFTDLISGTDTVDLFALNQAKAYDQWIESISTTSTQIADLREEIEKTQQAVADGDLVGSTGEEYIKGLESQIKALEVNPFESMTQGAIDALGAMSNMFESGSKDAKKLAIAMESLNLVQAVGAVLNQGNGDPYTAFGRMATMATMVASLGMSIGGLSGGLSDNSVNNQANQNLNSWGEHSESIADSTELVANATGKLVGINTNMLEALKGLNLSITAAADISARNINTPSVSVNIKDNVFDGLQNLFSGDVLNLTGLLGDTFVELLNMPLNLLGSWLGGSSSVADEGIRIMGGYITDLIDDVTIDAFQTVKYKKWKFGSTKNKTQYENVGDDVESQFSLVFESIANSVAVGAEMLGMSQSEIEQAINSFEIATQNLSLKGLDVDERVEVINNYFSSVFNDLTLAVVPFLEDFQKAGEELGETLSRLATEVAVAEYLVDNLGVNFGDKMANPEAFAQAATNLAALAGGVEELAQQTSSFTNAFATDAQKFEIYEKALNGALQEVGLTLPSTTEGMYDLMASLDGTTEEGQKQIAALLGITDTASAYYKLLEDINEEMEAAANSGDVYRDAAKGLYEVTEATKAMSLDAALAAARLGDMSLAEELNLSNIGPSKDDFSSLIDYNIATAEAAAKLNELADLQEGKVTVEDKQLTVLEEIRDKLTSDSNDLQISELSNQMTNLNSIQSMQSRNIADSNALLQQMVIDGIPVRVES